MGAWGPAIFSSDTACDVRGTYEDMLCYGHTPEEAEAQTMKEMEMDRLHPEDDPDAWLALAATEWRCGRKLSDDVRAIAMALIDQPIPTDLWKTEKLRLSRRKALDKLRDQLNAPLPKPKRLRPLPTIHSPWQVGDVIAVKLPEKEERPALSGKYALLLFTEIRTSKVSRYAPETMTRDTPYFVTYYWWGDDLSQCKEVIDRQVFMAKDSSVLVSRDVEKPIQEIFRSYALYKSEMKQYKEHPVVAHVDLPDLTEIKSKYHYYGGYGLSERATLLFIQYNLLKCTPLQLPLYAPAQVHMLYAD